MSVERIVSAVFGAGNPEFKTCQPHFYDDEVRELDKTLGKIKSSLKKTLRRVPDYQIDLPEFFLQEPLSDEQRQVIDDKLGRYYASRSVAQQEDVAQVEIDESDEPMVALLDFFEKESIPVSFSNLPFSPACGEWAGKQRVFYVRMSVAERVLIVAKSLTEVNIMLHFEDAFRPIGVQEGLFKRRVEWIQKDHPDWSWDSVMLEAKSKTAVSPKLASHKSGAAMDITLRTASTNIPLDLGNKYPEGGALVAIDCPFVTANQWHTRQLFANIFRMAGFAIYSGEDWHVSYGDNLHAQTFGLSTAKYGPLKLFDRASGKIISVYQGDELDSDFSKFEKT